MSELQNLIEEWFESYEQELEEQATIEAWVNPFRGE